MKTGPEKFDTAKDQSPGADPKPTATICLSRQQQEALSICVALGELFFSRRGQKSGAIQPRLFPLLCAPTGSGKSMLVAEAANRLGAYYKRSQRGDLAPQGAARMRASPFQLLDLLSQHERVLWHVDELDKFTAGSDGTPAAPGEWTASMFSDLWSSLDGIFPIESYLTLEDRPRAKDPTVNAEFLSNRVRSCLFIVGTGTWQMLFARRASREET